MILFVSALKIWIRLTSNKIDKTRWLSGWEAQVRGNAALGTDSRGLCYGILWLRVLLDNQSDAGIPFCDRMFHQHNVGSVRDVHSTHRQKNDSAVSLTATNSHIHSQCHISKEIDLILLKWNFIRGKPSWIQREIQFCYFRRTFYR